MKPIKHLMLCLLLLVYAGQSVAAFGTPCLMMGMAAGEVVEAASTDTAAMSHAGHPMGAPGQAAEAEADTSCCDGGLCSMSHCQSAAALPSTALPDGIAYVAIYSDISLPWADKPATESLYRPPIFR